MSERKVLNKYYPPDFDPNNIPRCKIQRNKTFGVRLMAPCNMKCNTCGEYIAKAKKFNARKEDVDDENYLGLRIYRFYIKCPMCMAEIVFKTDPEHTDYIIEAGATRNFQAQILAQRQAQAEADKAEEEEKSNPMKMLENRTKQSRHEMDMIEKLEELKDLNQRQAHVNYDSMLKQYSIVQQQLEQQQEAEDEQYVKSVFGSADGCVKRLRDSDSDSDESSCGAASNTRTPGLLSNSAQPTDILTQPAQSVSSAVEKKPWERSLGSLGGGKKSGSSLLGIVRPPNSATKSSVNAVQSSASATKSAATVTGAFKRPNLGITRPNINVGDTAVENGSSSSRNAGRTSVEERLRVSATNGDGKVNGKCLTDGDVEGGSVSIAAVSKSGREIAALTEPTKSVSAPTGLGLLGAYSDTDSDE